MLPLATRPTEPPITQHQTLPAGSSQLRQQLDHPQTVLILLAVSLAIQIIFPLWAAEFSLAPWLERLAGWDSSWYIRIATEGYSSDRMFAFFPLWPLTIGTLSKLLGVSAVQVVGMGVSLVFFCAALYLLSPPYSPNDKATAQGALPLVRAHHSLQLLPVLFAPGAWVYATNHTEALFLFLTVFAFQRAYRGDLVVASLVVGCAALTRNQGVLAAIAIGCYFALNPPKRKGKHAPLWGFVQSGLISGAVFALWPLYQFVATGNPMASIEAQQYWQHATSIKQFFDNMLWISPLSAPRVLWFWAILFTGIFLMVRKTDRHLTLPIGLYLVLSVLIWPMQGYKAPNGLRFGAVIFPFWLLVGHVLTSYLFTIGDSVRAIGRRILGFSLASYLITGMVVATCHYFFTGIWPY